MESRNLEDALVGAIEHNAKKKLGAALIFGFWIQQQPDLAWPLVVLGGMFVLVQAAMDAFEKWLAKENAIIQVEKLKDNESAPQ